MSDRTYSTKQNARRALKSVCKNCVKHAAAIIYETEDGRWALNEDLIEKYMDVNEWQEVYGTTGSGLPVEPTEEQDDLGSLDNVETRYENQSMVVQQAVATAIRTEIKREAQKTSMKLDRRISVVGSGEIYKNACAMWKANPTWMTSAQEDRLTKVLYAAAKRGEKIVVEINGRAFELVNIG